MCHTLHYYAPHCTLLSASLYITTCHTLHYYVPHSTLLRATLHITTRHTLHYYALHTIILVVVVIYYTHYITTCFNVLQGGHSTRVGVTWVRRQQWTAKVARVAGPGGCHAWPSTQQVGAPPPTPTHPPTHPPTHLPTHPPTHTNTHTPTHKRHLYAVQGCCWRSAQQVGAPPPPLTTQSSPTCGGGAGGVQGYAGAVEPVVVVLAGSTDAVEDQRA